MRRSWIAQLVYSVPVYRLALGLEPRRQLTILAANGLLHALDRVMT